MVSPGAPSDPPGSLPAVTPLILETSLYRQLATCVNYAYLNNSMLRMHGHASTGFFCCDVLFLHGKQNGFHHTVASAQSDFFE